MTTTIIWQQNSNNPDNADNFASISQWWSSLNGKEISLAQRIIPESGNLDEIDWEIQRFDEKLTLINPEIRGITVYWQKIDTEDDRNITPHKLELTSDRETLYIYPQSQPNIVIRIVFPQINYQTIELNDPQMIGAAIGDNYLLLLRDKEQKLEVKINLSSAKVIKKENPYLLIPIKSKSS